MIGHECVHCGLRVYLPSELSRKCMGLAPGVLVCEKLGEGGLDGTRCTRPEGHEVKP